ncbi:hypothetical protein NBH00_20730 [Paraconexibacter antarcticus]|uniref:ZIP family metal transporter n=1 Tax=Paraconexibacter antarcticus TaxID=2949664 RepID=A0ABY5DRQ2_9ACTN|nr:hypothetical protein [Paraconexibacter antarcticus]UTI63757.1 hypothetical protein NBH00_20730 [Paraconexibacter antarcticus]
MAAGQAAVPAATLHACPADADGNDRPRPRPALVVGVAALTVLATGLGAVPVLFVAEQAARLRPWLDGLVIWVMGVAAVAGLLVPAFRTGSPPALVLGTVAGAGGLWWARRRLRARSGPGPGPGAVAEERARLTFGIFFVHSLPEGLALGSAMAAAGPLAVFVVLAVAIQNIPEGTATALAMRAAGRGRADQVRSAVLTSVPQVPGAVAAWLAVDAVDAVLPASFAAAGAAMLLLVLGDLVPEARTSGSPARVAGGALGGGGVMVALAVLLNAPGA